MPGLGKFMAFRILAQLLVSLRKTGLVHGARSILWEECLKASSIPSDCEPLKVGSGSCQSELGWKLRNDGAVRYTY